MKATSGTGQRLRLGEETRASNGHVVETKFLELMHATLLILIIVVIIIMFSDAFKLHACVRNFLERRSNFLTVGGTR